MTEQHIVAIIWCNRTAEEAGRFYAEVLPGTTSTVTSRYPSDPPDFQADFADEVLTVRVEVEGYAIDLINAGDEFRPNPSISFLLNFDPLRHDRDVDATRAELDRVWAGLVDGGRVLMELGEYPFSPHYGWLEDRYGASWQLMLTNPDGDPRPFVIPQLMFTGQSRAREAMEYYTSLFADSGIGTVVDYAAGAPTSGVMFAEFRLADQWFMAMDGGTDHEFTFDCGVSLAVSCPDQAEIDRLWNALSAVPEAEACGWLADRFGVAWQIVPADIESLMARPGAYSNMLTMKRIVIADL